MSEKWTSGPWECQIGHSDWGMPTEHVIVRTGETGNDYDTWIATVPSVTPYCLGASRKDIRRASLQQANAHLLAAAPELAEVVKAFIAETVDYMARNNLGDPEKQHNVKWGRSVLAKARGES